MHNQVYFTILSKVYPIKLKIFDSHNRLVICETLKKEFNACLCSNSCSFLISIKYKNQTQFQRINVGINNHICWCFQPIVAPPQSITTQFFQLLDSNYGIPITAQLNFANLE